MDSDRSRFFLLSIISVPAACGPGNPGASVVDDGAIPVEDDDGVLDPSNGDDGPGPNRQGCEAFFTSLADCYVRPGGSYGEGGYEGGGGGVVAIPDIAELCGELDAVADNYGSDCANAIDEALACMAAFACQDLGESQLTELCAMEVGRAQAYCPNVNPPPQPDTTAGTTPDPTFGTASDVTGAEDTGSGLCPSSGNFTDSTTCVAQYDTCPDGNSYEITCSPATSGGLHTCVCTTNGQQTSTFDVDNPCTGAYEGLAATSCGFPVEP